MNKQLLFGCIAALAVSVASAGSLVESWETGGRAETLKWFEDNQFGKTPIGRPADERIGDRSVEFVDSGIKINITCCLPKEASADHPVPVFLFMDHRGGEKAPDYPQEELAGIPTNAITARGYAYVRWNGNDVCPNASRYTGTLGRWPVGVVSYCATRDRSATNVVRTAGSWGTIGAWAWGNSRVMDWIETRPELDARRVAVLGHSRGGKTALWTGAQDTRFALTISNGSGCGGARLGRAKDPKAETFRQILHNFPNWFCPAFSEWIGRDAEIPHDADDLIRLIAPRLVYVASGSTDAWAGPRAEKAAWDAAHDLYRAYGHEDRMGYHCHEGPHQLRADDWEKFMDFADAHWKATAASAGSPVVSEVRPYGGMPTLWIDGKPSTGCMFWSGRWDSDKDIEVMRKAGVHLYQPGCSINADNPDGSDQIVQQGLDRMDAKIELIVRGDPEAKLLVRIGTRIPFVDWWKKIHPEERVRYYDIPTGTYMWADWASPSSPSWNALMYDSVRRVVRHCEEKWPDRVIGYLPGTCSYTENMYMFGNRIADLSSCQIQAFARPAPDPKAFLSQHPFDTRRLLDPVKDGDAVAFQRFQARTMGETVCRLAHAVKDELGTLGRRKVCGVFYGYMCFSAHGANFLCDGHQAQEMVFSSPEVDFVTAPIDYNARQLGGASYAQLMPGAVSVRGKLYYAEDDSRLHLARGHGNQTATTREASRWTILRNFFDAYSHGGALWWMDLYSQGWYRDDWFSIPLDECRVFAERHLDRRESVAEIAVFAHPEATAYERTAPSLLSAELIGGEMPEICAIGAPYDIYHLSDVSLLAKSGRLRPYKMAVILNAHTIDTALRRVVRECLFRDGRTVVFLGPAGWNTESAHGPTFVKDLTGFSVRERSSSDGSQVESFVDGRRIVFGSPLTSEPSLVITDPAARPLGWRVFASDCGRPDDLGGAVLAEKDFPGWKGVLCTANSLPSDLLRRLAEGAGVHIYSSHGDQVFAGPGWFAVAAKMPGKHRLVPRNGTPVTLEMKRGEVRWFE